MTDIINQLYSDKDIWNPNVPVLYIANNLTTAHARNAIISCLNYFASDSNVVINIAKDYNFLVLDKIDVRYAIKYLRQLEQLWTDIFCTLAQQKDTPLALYGLIRLNDNSVIVATGHGIRSSRDTDVDELAISSAMRFTRRVLL